MQSVHLNTERVIFIGGSGRSGTTLLSELLDFHPKIASIFEVHSFVFLLKCIRSGTVPGRPLLESQREVLHEALIPSTEYNWHMTLDEAIFCWQVYVTEPILTGRPVIEAARTWMDSVHKIQMIRDGSEFIAHKTPVLASYLPEIKEIYPDSIFVHMIRSPERVIDSYLLQDWGPTTIPDGIDWYCERVGDFMKQASLYSNCMTIKFEDLLSSPEAILDQIQEAVGISQDTNTILDRNLIDQTKKEPSLKRLGQDDVQKIHDEIRNRLPAIRDIYPG
jgi:hypothetical protein